MTVETVRTMMTKLYDFTRNKSLMLYYRSRFLSTLYDKAKNAFDNNSKFFKLLTRLYEYNRRTNIFISKNNSYIKIIMDEFNVEYRKLQALNEEQREQSESSNIKKAALLIGINYFNTKYELYGCENDVRDMKQILIDNYNYKDEDIMILKESSGNPDELPNRKNILRALQWMVDKSNEGYNSLMLQYSGHGYYIRDINGDETDGFDECIVTSDFFPITDDEFKRNFVNLINKDSKLFCLMDCCYSGTMLDLGYKYNIENFQLERESSVLSNVNALALSGCLDSELSADANFINGGWSGALTKNLLYVLKKYNYSVDLNKLVSEIRSNLKQQNFTQNPLITSSKEISPDQKFSL